MCLLDKVDSLQLIAIGESKMYGLKRTKQRIIELGYKSNHYTVNGWQRLFKQSDHPLWNKCTSRNESVICVLHEGYMLYYTLRDSVDTP